MLYSLTQSHPTLCNPTDYNPPGFSLHGILQAITLEWVAMPSSRGSSQLSDQTRSPALLVDSWPSEPPGYKQWINKYGTTAPRGHIGLGSFNPLVNWLTHDLVLCGFLFQFSHTVTSDSLWPHGLQHTRLPYSTPTPGAHSNSCLSSWWCHPTISSLLSPSPAFNVSQHQGLF